MSRVVTLVGAESTGKTTLARDMAEQLRQEGHRAEWVPEYLREFCDHHGRTPCVDEQAGIAAEQMRRIADAARQHDVVIADTSALMIAVYSEQLFGDTSLYAQAEAAQRGYALTLLTALDLPWQADGLMRDGPQVRAPVDALVRRSLARAGVAFCVVAGNGPARLDAAMNALRRLLEAPSAANAPRSTRWEWRCERCGDAACERHLMLPRG